MARLKLLLCAVLGGTWLLHTCSAAAKGARRERVNDTHGRQVCPSTGGTGRLAQSAVGVGCGTTTDDARGLTARLVLPSALHVACVSWDSM